MRKGRSKLRVAHGQSSVTMLVVAKNIMKVIPHRSGLSWITKSLQQWNDSSFSICHHLQCQHLSTWDQTVTISIRTSIMLCLWWYVSVLCCRFHLLHSAFMWQLGVSVICHWQLAVALRYHVFLLSIMARYNGKIMHKDRSGLAVTWAHCPVTVLVAVENTMNVTR